MKVTRLELPRSGGVANTATRGVSSRLAPGELPMKVTRLELPRSGGVSTTGVISCSAPGEKPE